MGAAQEAQRLPRQRGKFPADAPAQLVDPRAQARRVRDRVVRAHEEDEDNRLIYARNRQLLLDRLPTIGLSRFAPPDGAFYFYVDVSRFTTDSLSFSRRLLIEAGVAVTPGVDFDPQNGGHWIRLSYAGPETEVAEGVARLADWLAPQIG